MTFGSWYHRMSRLETRGLCFEMKLFPEQSFAHNPAIYVRWSKWGRICTVTLGGSPTSLLPFCGCFHLLHMKRMSQLWIYRPICALPKNAFAINVSYIVLWTGGHICLLLCFVGTGIVKGWILYECSESAELFSSNECTGPKCAHGIASITCWCREAFFLILEICFRSFCCSAFQTGQSFYFSLCYSLTCTKIKWRLQRIGGVRMSWFQL